MAIPDSVRSIGRPLMVLGACVLPVILVLLLPVLAGWGEVLPIVVEAADETSLAPEVLAELSSDMNAIAIGVIVAAAVLLREWRERRPPKRLWAAALIVFYTAVASCYAGVRFRFAIAEQILSVRLDLETIGDRLATQGLLLLASVSLLIYMALLSFLGEPSQRGSKHPSAKAPAPRKRKAVRKS